MGNLWEQVMRTKYYPDGEFMTAQLGANPSYTWRGLMEARGVLATGMRRRIGDGKSTRVWHDVWLPETHTGRVISPCVAGNENLRVCDLLSEQGGWDVERVSSLFLPFETERILNIRVSHLRPMDIWYWNAEKDGMYSVKSAYRHLAGGDGMEEGLGIGGGEGAMECEIRDWVEGRWRELGGREHKLFMLGCWAIWEHRNKVIFDAKEVDPWVVIIRVGDVVAEMEGTEQEVRRGRRRRKDGVENEEGGGWQPAPSGCVKINVDAGVKEGEGVSLGIVCRDDRGAVLWGISVVQDHIWEPHVAEAVAVFEGVKEAKRRGYRDIVVESDCAQVIEALNKKQTGRSSFMLVLDEILCVSEFFNSIVWLFSSRVNNSVAHALAHVYPRISGRREWSSVLPSTANDAVLFDLSLLK
ncbi:uncharacterized protein LOC141613242 [Silene latifolia]|uniref:uncharacterized protein LOC141613242 n=1 Tax=Silene latifolia TaxID=37657 RepID=UPI003D76C89D